MKKLIGTAMLAALLATSAFAEITMGAWLRVLAAPVAYDGDDIVSGMTNSWGWGARVARVDFNGASDDEKVGFSMSVFNDAYNGITAGDNYAIWAKPWDFLKVSFGKWDYTAFRGDLCFGSWNWIRPNNWFAADEGLTFDQLGNQNGIQIELTPIEGLLIMWNLPLESGFNDAYKMFQKQDIAAKYTIGDIGTIKAGWEGQTSEYNGDAKKLGDINVAFDLTAVENLYLTVGVKVNIANSDAKTDGTEFLKAAAGMSYQIADNFKLSASLAVQTYEEVDPALQVGVGVDVGLTDELTLNADVRALFGDLGDIDPTISFLVGLQYSISSNGYVGIGFQGSTNSCGFLSEAGGIKAAKADAFCWAVPIAISCWF
ncbi:MAG: hypothetical protein K2J68_10460 [Treponemataceae bacterium]|nr:hypothetical protein [Treponemataceae bacterium]